MDSVASWNKNVDYIDLCTIFSLLRFIIHRFIIQIRFHRLKSGVLLIINVILLFTRQTLFLDYFFDSCLLRRKIDNKTTIYVSICTNRMLVHNSVFQTHFSCQTQLKENYSLLVLGAMANVLENDPKWRFIRFNSYYWLCASGNRFIVPIRQREYILIFSVATVSIELIFSLKWYYTEFIQQLIENDYDWRQKICIWFF